MSDVQIYREPLWVQTGEYSAEDMRQVIDAALWPGVIDPSHLRVIPRTTGPNLSVDVEPGLVVVAGTDQAAQGSYLCPLAQKVNIPVTHGPAPPNTRTDLIIARVYEPGDAPAYWRIEPLLGTANPDGQWQFPPAPPSSLALAAVAVGDQFVTQITPDRITDLRHLSRPVPMGSTFLAQTALGPNATFLPNETRWGALRKQLPGGVPGEQPMPTLDLEVRVEGMFRTENGPPAEGSIAINLSVGPATASWTHRLDAAQLYSRTLDSQQSFSRTLVARVTPNFGDRILAEAAIAELPRSGSGGARFHSGLLTVRGTPAGAAL